MPSNPNLQVCSVEGCERSDIKAKVSADCTMTVNEMPNFVQISLPRHLRFCSKTKFAPTKGVSAS